MNRFIIINGLPYLYADGKAYQCRWDDDGFTVGAEVKLTSAPVEIFSDLSVKAQCADRLDSIAATVKKEEEEDTDIIDSLSLEELKKYAAEKCIKIGSARTKPTIIEAIKKASALEA